MKSPTIIGLLTLAVMIGLAVVPAIVGYGNLEARLFNVEDRVEDHIDKTEDLPIMLQRMETNQEWMMLRLEELKGK